MFILWLTFQLTKLLNSSDKSIMHSSKLNPEYVNIKVELMQICFLIFSFDPPLTGYITEFLGFCLSCQNVPWES